MFLLQYALEVSPCILKIERIIAVCTSSVKDKGIPICNPLKISKKSKIKIETQVKMGEKNRLETTLREEETRVRNLKV